MNWKRTWCTKIKYSGAISAAMILAETRGSKLKDDSIGMANTHTHEKNLKAMGFQQPVEEMTWKRTCCTKIKDCDATSAPVSLPLALCSRLDGGLLGVANTNPREETLQAVKFPQIKSFYFGPPRAQEERTCLDLKDCDAKAILPETRGSQFDNELLAVAG